MVTKAELIERGLELESQLVPTVEDVTDLLFIRDPEIPGGVLIGTFPGIVVLSAEDWMNAVCKVSVGGNNSANQAIVRNLHLG